MSETDSLTPGKYREQLFKELIEIVGELGWSVCIPQGPEDEEVPGLIIGTDEYVEKVTRALEEQDGRSSK